jgi:thiol-disulfide isomerase/thioredoxin
VSNAPNPSTGRRLPVVWIVLIGVVVVAGVVAVVLARRSGSGEVANQTTPKIVVGTTTTTTAPTGPTTSGPTATTASTAPASTTGTLPLFEATQADSAVGTVIPTVSGLDFDGKPITIGPDGKAKVIVFVAHWCPHCQAEVPRIVAHLKDTPMPDDVELVSVSTAVQVGAENYPPQAWLEREQWPAPVLADDADGTVAQAYGLRSFPYFVVADKDGKVVVRTSGEITMDDFDVLVQAARTGKLPG